MSVMPLNKRVRVHLRDDENPNGGTFMGGSFEDVVTGEEVERGEVYFSFENRYRLWAEAIKKVEVLDDSGNVVETIEIVVTKST